MAPCPAGAVTQRYPADMSKFKAPFRLRTLSVSVAATSALVSSMALAAEPTASACTDFYTHINGQWIANTELPPDRARTGPERRTGNVTADDFKATFGFRGVQFGNWNNQDERQALMNDAWDGLMDLADVLGLPPKALGLNGDLALAYQFPRFEATNLMQMAAGNVLAKMRTIKSDRVVQLDRKSVV